MHPRGQTKGSRTDEGGRVFDNYKIPFNRPDGQVTIIQGLTVGESKTGAWQTIVRANGSYNLMGETPEGNIMSLH